MNIFPIKSRFLAGFFLFLIAYPVQGMQRQQIMPSSAHFLASKNAEIVCLVAGAVLGAGLVEYVYTYAKKAYNQYLENKVIDATVEYIVTMLTPHTILTPETTVRKKARLICMRKRIMAALTNPKKIPDTLSPEHAAIIQKNVKMAEKIFKGIDLIRKKNPFEHEYLEATIADMLIENSVIKSIWLSTKPDDECTPGELKEKQAQKARREKIIDRLKIKINGIILNKVIPILLIAL